jgi:hypothetical protein
VLTKLLTIRDVEGMRGRCQRDHCPSREIPLALFFASNGSDCLERRFFRRRQVVVEHM